MKIELIITLFLLALADVLRGDAAETLRVYFIGNSVTDTVRYESLEKLIATRGGKLDWGRTMSRDQEHRWAGHVSVFHRNALKEILSDCKTCFCGAQS